MTRMTGPDCVVMCNLINTYIHTYIHTCIHTYIHYAKGSIVVMLLQKVDTHYTLLQGHVVLGDVIPLRILSSEDHLCLRR